MPPNVSIVANGMDARVVTGMEPNALVLDARLRVRRLLTGLAVGRCHVVLETEAVLLGNVVREALVGIASVISARVVQDRN
jgi:hypothetical protein